MGFWIPPEDGRMWAPPYLSAFIRVHYHIYTLNAFKTSPAAQFRSEIWEKFGVTHPVNALFLGGGGELWEGNTQILLLLKFCSSCRRSSAQNSYFHLLMKETEIFSKKLPTLSSLRRLCPTPQTICPCRRHLSCVQLQLSTQLWLYQLHEENHLLLHATTEHSCRCHILVTIFRAFCMITLCFHPNYCIGKSFSQPWTVEKKSSNLHPIFFFWGGGVRWKYERNQWGIHIEVVSR